MRLTRTQLSFISVLAAGLFLMVGSLLLPTTTTYGVETDVPLVDVDLSDLRNPVAPQPAPPAAPAPVAPAPSQPLPPQAPIESPTGGVGAQATQLPSAGNGGYLGGSGPATAGYLLMGLGAALLGTGSFVWVYSRRTR